MVERREKLAAVDWQELTLAIAYCVGWYFCHVECGLSWTSLPVSAKILSNNLTSLYFNRYPGEDGEFRNILLMHCSIGECDFHLWAVRLVSL